MSTAGHKPESKSRSNKPPTYIPLVLKTKSADGKTWRIHGYLNLRADLSGGVGTLVLPDGTKLEKVAIFPNDKKPKSEKDAAA